MQDTNSGDGEGCDKQPSTLRYNEHIELLQNAGFGFWEWDIRSNRTTWSDEVAGIWGVEPGLSFDREFVIGSIHPEDQRPVQALIQQCLDVGPQDFEMRIVRDDGQLRWVRVMARARERDGAPSHVLGMLSDVTWRHEVRSERERLLEALDQSRDLIVITSVSGEIEYANPAVVVATGYPMEELLGQGRTFFTHPNTQDEVFHEQIRQTVESGRTWRGVMLGHHRSGATFTVEAVISPTYDAQGEIVNYITVSRDITERRRLEEQVQLAERMVAVGRLAGGIAHEFNNALQTIMGNASLALSMPLSPDVRPLLDEIQEATERSAELTQQLLTFSNSQMTEPREVDLNAHLDGALATLRRVTPESIELNWHPGRDLWPLWIDPVQVHQLITHLCTNAQEALGDVGAITVETQNVVIKEDTPWLTARPDAQPGEFVRMRVRDDGEGMAPEVMSAMFDPFFTTRSPGQHLGLGLTVVYGIVRQAGGFIDVESVPGQGTRLSVYLPRSERRATPPVKQQPDPAARTRSPTPTPRSSSVLMVEDEPLLLRLGERILGGLGYTVHTAQRPSEALRLAAQLKKLDLLVTDVMMPEMNGVELASRLTAMHPELRSLYISGHIVDEFKELKQGVNFLAKPFAIHTLAELAERLLEER